MEHYTFSVENSPFPAPARGRGRRARVPGLSTGHSSPLPPPSLESAPYLDADCVERNSRVLVSVNHNTGDVTVNRGLVGSVPVVRDYGTFEGWDGGNLISLTAPYSTSTARVSGGGVRGKIQTFTKASRRRLLRLLAKVDKREALPIFVTLTYPGEYPHEWQTWKRHIDTLCKRIARRYPSSGLVWRLEPQKRGAPHYHLLVWGVPSMLLFREWVAQAWYEVAHNGDKHLGSAGTRTESVRSARGVMFYAGKYLAKLPEGASAEDWAAGVGRWWGMRNPENIPWASRIVRKLFPYESSIVMAAMLAHAELSPGQWKRVTVYGDGDEWLAFVANLVNRKGSESC
jgi:hypothetical protein